MEDKDDSKADVGYFFEQNKMDVPYEAWAFCDGGEVGDKLAGLVPFDQVSERNAWLEGEGDRSLDYWREVHREAFEPDYQAAGMDFDEKGLCVLEEFDVVYQ